MKCFVIWDVLPVPNSLKYFYFGSDKEVWHKCQKDDTELCVYNMILFSSLLGGSPYVAAKINEAKDLLDGQAKK